MEVNTHSFFTRLGVSRQYAISTGIVLLVAAICYALSGLMGYRVPAFILLVTVSILATSFDILPVLLAAALSAVIWDFFFIPPRYTIHVDTTEDLFLLVMYFFIALINGVLTYKIRQVEKIARIREERANSVKLYNTILNSLSHELRTPIAVITGAADNLQLNANLTPEMREQLIGEISKASLRLNQQVENLLNISRLESGHIQPRFDWCDIVELIYDTVKRVEENNAIRHVQISVKEPFHLCSTDKGMLEQIVYNLLNNAAIHTPPDSSIYISAVTHADLLEIMIEDTGNGFRDIMPADVFHKFSRKTQAQNSGSGLGLSIVKGFTEALGGRVVLEKSEEGGARFVVTLPVKTTSMELQPL